jgi:hypothetical protein
MARLGKKQLDYLARRAGVFSAQVVPDALTRSLAARGLLVGLSDKTDGFLALTPAAYRAVADALEAGTITRPPVADWGKS